MGTVKIFVQKLRNRMLKDRIKKIWLEETVNDSEACSQMQLFERNLQKKLIESYSKRFERPNPSFSLELVQSFSFRSIMHQYETYSDPYPFMLLRKRALIIFR